MSATSLSSIASAADTYPTKPIRFIVPSAPGSGTDIIARILGQKLSERWGQPVIIDDREGAGGVIGTELAARSPPDGYTLYMGFTGPLAVSPASVQKTSLRSDQGFRTRLADRCFTGRIGRASVGCRNFSEGTDRSRQIAIRFAQLRVCRKRHHRPHVGRAPEDDVQNRHGPCADKSVSQALTDVLGGQLQLLFHVAPAVMPHVKAGKLRALGVTSLTRWSILPDLPTLAEAGVPGYESTVWHGVLVPAQNAGAARQQAAPGDREQHHEDA